MKNENIQILRQALAEIGLRTDDDAVAKLVQYHDLLMQQNAMYNLTGHKDEDTSIRLNLLNSLAAAKALKSKNNAEIADIGTGAGFPGIPWSILMPDTRFHLVDNKLKKINFLKLVVKTLGLRNVALYQKNIFEIKRKFAILVFQAFGKISKVAQVVESCMQNDGHTYLFASDYEKIKTELDSLRNFNHEVLSFTISELSEYKRNLIYLSKSN